MANSPVWKIYGADGRYEAAAKSAWLAAAIASVLGKGATVRHNHGRTVWREGVDGSALDRERGGYADCVRVMLLRRAGVGS